MVEGLGLKEAICLATPNRNSYSETFIHAHIDRLPARVCVLHDSDFSGNVSAGTGRRNGLQWLLQSFRRRILRVDWDTFRREALKSALRTSGARAVLAEYGPTGVAFADVCDALGVPLIVHFHGYDAYHKETLEYYGEGYRRMFDVAAAVIGVSHDMVAQLGRLGAPPQKIHYCPYGVDLSLFRDAAPGSAPPLFVAVGRFADKKGPALTVLAFWKVLQTCADARLVMIGDGPLWDVCRQIARSLGITACIEFRGAADPEKVAAALKEARGFVQHSVRPGCGPAEGDSEGTPVAVLEACAAGLPIVATRHAGIKDVVVEGETGFLCEEGDIDTMARNITRLALDPGLAGDMGTKAHARAEAEFSMEQSIARLWAIIEKAIEVGGKEAP